MSWAAVAAGVGGLVAGSMNKPKQDVTSSASSAPWAGVAPWLSSHLYPRAYDQSVAQQSPLTTQAQQLTTQKALDPNSLTGQAQGLLSSTMRGDYLNPSTNPNFAAAINDSLGLAKSQFAGQYGGNAGSNLSNSGYQEALARGLGATATNAYANQYSKERQNQLSATQQAPSLDFAGIDRLAGVGQQQQDYPWQQLQRFSGMLTGSGGGSSTQTTPYFSNPAASALGGAMGGMSLYNMGNQQGWWGNGSGTPSYGSSYNGVGSDPFAWSNASYDV